jgi:hypothetical protein
MFKRYTLSAGCGGTVIVVLVIGFTAKIETEANPSG